MALKALPAMMHCHKIGVFEGHAHPNSTKNNITCLGGYRPSIRCLGAEQKVSCGVLGGHFRRRQPWLAMVVMVVGGVRHIDLL